MARNGGDGGDEWRRSIGQSEGNGPPPRPDAADAPEPWEFAGSNAMPVDTPRVPRREITLEVPDETPRPFDEQYVADAKAGVASARAAYRRLMRIFWTLRFGVITSGLLVAVLSAAGAPIWTIASLGALAAAIEAVMASTNLHNRATARGLYADAVAYELRTFSLKIAPYAGDDAVEVLHRKVEALRSSASAALFKLDQTAAAEPSS